MTRKNPLRDRERMIFKTEVTPLLERAGFDKQGVAYVRTCGRIVHLLDVQQSQGNRIDKVDFTMNCGVYVPGVWKTFTGHDEQTKPGQLPVTLHARPAMLRPSGLDKWWEIKSSDGPERDVEVQLEIKEIVEMNALPFFDRFRDEAAVAEFLSQPRKREDRYIDPRSESLCVAYAGIIWSQLGAFDKCQACMTRAAELAKGKRLEADVERFAKAFVCGGKVVKA